MVKIIIMVTVKVKVKVKVVVKSRSRLWLVKPRKQFRWRGCWVNKSGVLMFDVRLNVCKEVIVKFMVKVMVKFTYMFMFQVNVN